MDFLYKLVLSSFDNLHNLHYSESEINTLKKIVLLK